MQQKTLDFFIKKCLPKKFSTGICMKFSLTEVDSAFFGLNRLLLHSGKYWGFFNVFFYQYVSYLPLRYWLFKTMVLLV